MKSENSTAHAAERTGRGTRYTFPQGVYGFETRHRFVLLQDEQDPANPFMWLRSEEDASVSFAVLDAARLFTDYTPPVPDGAARILQLRKEESPRFLVIASVPGEGKRLFLNLKCPVALNPARRLGLQLILEDERFPMRYYPPLRQGG